MQQFHHHPKTLCRLTRFLFLTLAALCAFAPLDLLFGSSRAEMHSVPSLEPPPFVRITGAFFQPGQPTPTGLSTLTVSFKDVKRSFVVKKMEKVTGKPTTDLRLLESLFPPTLRLVGPAALLDSLQQSDALGKFFVLEGRFYADDKMLLLLSAEEE